MSKSRTTLAALCIVCLALATAPTAGAAAYIYWWQRNMPPNATGYDRTAAHNHTYNELYFGPNAGWSSEVWEVTPAGSRHYDKRCSGNCFNSHPGTYFTYAYCSNRDGGTHFVNRCMDQW